MAYAGDAITRIVKDLCKKHPDAAARTLAKRVVTETGNAITIEQARKRIARQFGVMGAHGRRWCIDTGVRRKPRKAGAVSPPPPTKAEPWGPYVLDATGLVGVLSDIHVPFHSEVALKAAVDKLRGDRIEALILNGDTCDFYAISRYIKTPAKRNFKSEVAAARDMLAWIRGRFPKIPIVFKCGNHEERWNHWLYQHAPEISDEPIMGLDNWLQLPKHGIEMVDDQRPILAGKLPILHGHEKGKGISAPVNQARGAFLRLHHTVLEGHGHRTSGHCEPDMWGREVFCWSTGCLCDLHPEYARINKFNHGFASVNVEASGEFDVTNFRITNDGKVRQS
jgi:predicted phosphodiesterase